MKFICTFLIILFFLVFPNLAIAGLFSKNSPSSSSSGAPEQSADDIPIRDAAYKMIERRKQEAHKLISEGLEIMREGEKKKNEVLITKGRIKKEIGQKQLEVLKEQAEEKKKDDKSYGF